MVVRSATKVTKNIILAAKKLKELQASRNTGTNQDPIAAKIDEKIEEKVDDVVNQKTNEGLV